MILNSRLLKGLIIMDAVASRAGRFAFATIASVLVVTIIVVVAVVITASAAAVAASTVAASAVAARAAAARPASLLFTTLTTVSSSVSRAAGLAIVAGLDGSENGENEHNNVCQDEKDRPGVGAKTCPHGNGTKNKDRDGPQNPSADRVHAKRKIGCKKEGSQVESVKKGCHKGHAHNTRKVSHGFFLPRFKKPKTRTKSQKLVLQKNDIKCLKNI